jgi:hypothetical protein
MGKVPKSPAKPGISSLKKQFHATHVTALKKELERVQTENKALREDPDSVVGKFLDNYNKVVAQNNRLSAALCGVLEENGGSATVQMATIEAFVGFRLLFDLQQNAEEKTYTFTYRKEPIKKTPEVSD